MILRAAEAGWQHRWVQGPGVAVPQGLDHGEPILPAVAAGSSVEEQQQEHKSGPAGPEKVEAQDVAREKPHDLLVRPALHPAAS